MHSFWIQAPACREQRDFTDVLRRLFICGPRCVEGLLAVRMAVHAQSSLLWRRRTLIPERLSRPCIRPRHAAPVHPHPSVLAGSFFHVKKLQMAELAAGGCQKTK